MTATTLFVDCTGSNFPRAPLGADEYRGVYLTGEDGVPETTAEIDEAIAAGAPLIGIDQQPGLPLFRIGKAAVADVENGAATIADAVAAIANRRSLGIAFHTVYISQSRLAALQAAIGDLTGVWFWVANYAWSESNAINLLAANSNWGAVQFGDPGSNPLTLVPGTSIDLQMAQFDIDCGNVAWMQQAAGISAGPAPAPAPPAPAVIAAAPAWPFGPFDYLGTPRADRYCHSGYYSTLDAHVVSMWQQRMHDRGWYYQGARLVVNGRYGINEATLNQGACPTVCHLFEQEFGLGVDDLVGPKVWEAAWELAVTPG